MRSPLATRLMSYDLDTIRQDLAQQRERYRASLHELEQAIDPWRLRDDVAKELAAQAEEFGVDHTVRQISKSPAEFGLAADAAQAADKLTPLLETMTTVAGIIDQLTAFREALLDDVSPNRQRVYAAFGREFMVDETKDVLVYADGANEQVPLSLQHVPTKLAPKFAKDHDNEPAPRKARRPDRDR